MAKRKENINPEQGIRLSIIRKKRNITQDRLAELTGYSVQTISGIENGTRRMTLESATAFARELISRVEYLMCEDDYETYPELYRHIQKKCWDEYDALELLMKSFGYSYDWIDLDRYSSHFTDEMRDKNEYPIMIKLTSLNDEKIMTLKELEEAKKEMLEFIEFKCKKLIIKNDFNELPHYKQFG